MVDLWGLELETCTVSKKPGGDAPSRKAKHQTAQKDKT